MSKPTLDIAIKIVAESPNNIFVTDNTDYSAIGINPVDVKINARVYSPVGLMYSPAYYNTPETTNDFTPAIPFDYVTAEGDGAIPDILLDNKGCLINGVYKVEIKWYNSDTGEHYDYVYEETIKFVAPKINIEQSSDCFCPKFRSTDLTDYSNSIELDYIHKINYPAQTDEADIIVDLLDYTDTRLANGTYVTEIKTNRVFWVAGVFSVHKEIKGKKSHVVDCKSICDIKCGINTLYEKYKAACGVDKHEAERLLKLLNKSTMLYTLLYLNNGCGDTSKSDSYLSALKEILGDCDCGCTDCEDDTWVTGACGSSGSSEYDPSGLYTYIDNINTNLTNLINNYGDNLSALQDTIDTLTNKSWFEGLVTSCLNDYPDGTEIQNKQYILDAICALQDATNVLPVAHNDYSTTTVDISVDKLVTANDFFQTDATVTITTPAGNGTATVLGDNKTLHYVPGTGFVGTDTVGYTLTDSNGNTTTAIWTIIVNAVVSASCYTVVPAYNASLYSVGTHLQIAIANQSAIGVNTLTQEDYLIEIRNSVNAILYSYTVIGGLVSDPTIWTSPIPIANTWDNVRIVLTISTDSHSGEPCGTTTFESATPYSLNDISVSWFDGTTPPDCLGFVMYDDEIQKKDKLMGKICLISTQVDTNTSDIVDLNAAVAAIDINGYTDIEGTTTTSGGYTALLPLEVRLYNTDDVRIFGAFSFTGAKSISDVIISGLPSEGGLNLIIPVFMTISSVVTTAWVMVAGGQLVVMSGFTGTGDFVINYTYKKA